MDYCVVVDHGFKKKTQFNVRCNVKCNCRNTWFSCKYMSTRNEHAEHNDINSPLFFTQLHITHVQRKPMGYRANLRKMTECLHMKETKSNNNTKLAFGETRKCFGTQLKDLKTWQRTWMWVASVAAEMRSNDQWPKSMNYRNRTCVLVFLFMQQICDLLDCSLRFESGAF